MRIILLIFIILNSLETYAHSDYTTSVNRDNIHLKYSTGWPQLEINQKFEILLDLTVKLINTKGFNTEQLFIYFDHDYTQRDSLYFTLGYGKFTFNNYVNNKLIKDKTATGIKLIFRDRDFDISKILHLINSAFINVDYIKKNQTQSLLIDYNFKMTGNAQPDTLLSIPPEQIQKYATSSDTTLNRILNEKTYLNFKTDEANRPIDYYYQNNKFHFFNPKESNEVWSKEQNKYVLRRTYGEDILIVDNILEIVGSFNDGHLVFINDSIFYFIPQQKYNVRGPFKVDNVLAGRPPIFKYYHEDYPIERFTLFFDNYQSYNKAVFFPDSNMVISNFDKIENNFIKNLFLQQVNKKDKKQNRINDTVIIILLILSIMINIWLLIQQRR